MSWEDTNKDLDAYQQTLDAQKAAGADARIAEGRARSKAIRAHRDANPEEAAAHAAQARSAAPAAAAAAPAAAPRPLPPPAPRPEPRSPSPPRR